MWAALHLTARPELLRVAIGELQALAEAAAGARKGHAHTPAQRVHRATELTAAFVRASEGVIAPALAAAREDAAVAAAAVAAAEATAPPPPRQTE